MKKTLRFSMNLMCLLAGAQGFAHGSKPPAQPQPDPAEKIRPYFVTYKQTGPTKKRWPCGVIQKYIEDMYELKYISYTDGYNMFDCGIMMDGLFHVDFEFLLEAKTEKDLPKFAAYVNRHQQDTFDKNPIALNPIKGIRDRQEFWAYRFENNLLQDYGHIDNLSAHVFSTYKEWQSHLKQAKVAIFSPRFSDVIHFFEPYFTAQVFDDFLKTKVEGSTAVGSLNTATFLYGDNQEFDSSSNDAQLRNCEMVDHGACPRP